MTIIRLAQQQLVIHSAIPCDDETAAAIQELGKVSYLIMPNLEHTRFIKQWQQRYPTAQIYAPSATPLEYHVALDAGNNPPSQCSTNPLGLCYLSIDGIPRLQEFAFFHPESRTLILTDLAFNLGGDLSLWGKSFLRLNGAYNRFTSSRILKSWVKDKTALRASLQQIMKWEFEQIIIAHGTPVTDNARKTFKQAFEWAV